MSGAKDDAKNKGPDMAQVGLIFLVLGCAMPLIMQESHHPRYSSVPVIHIAPHREFSEDDDAFNERDYHQDGYFWCGDITEWKDKWMPKGYITKLTDGSDHTSHTFKNLKEAESFLQTKGCPR